MPPDITLDELLSMADGLGYYVEFSGPDLQNKFSVSLSCCVKAEGITSYAHGHGQHEDPRLAVKAAFKELEDRLNVKQSLMEMKEREEEND